MPQTCTHTAQCSRRTHFGGGEEATPSDRDTHGTALPDNGPRPRVTLRRLSRAQGGKTLAHARVRRGGACWRRGAARAAREAGPTGRHSRAEEAGRVAVRVRRALRKPAGPPVQARRWRRLWPRARAGGGGARRTGVRAGWRRLEDLGEPFPSAVGRAGAVGDGGWAGAGRAGKRP